ncbi:S26 family signal peptidase [Amnibacterium endophyticum]|uniref:S26 family signal peptidase n=1 Tax=Amnibacterium endophyticum TaxID=2109337 RepID=A0ABW4LGW1_9MICO
MSGRPESGRPLPDLAPTTMTSTADATGILAEPRLGPSGATAERPGGGRARVATRLLAAVALVAVAACAAAIAVTGARIFVVESPSMGRAAPVGTLVIGLPVQEGQALRDGEVITYHPPGSDSTYTHRIVQVEADGYRTRGDINGTDDPWIVRPDMIVTRAVALVPVAGWLVRLAPAVAGGCAAVWALGLLLRDPSRRASMRMLGCSLVLSAAFWFYKPFVGYLLLQARSCTGGVEATVVSTGVLPIRLQAAGDPAHAIDLVSGQVGRLTLPGDAHGHAGFTAAPHLDLLGWLLLALLCLAPTLWTLLRAERVEPDAVDA